jgi:hypothetical protein
MPQNILACDREQECCCRPLPDVVLADAGYWHQSQMESITGRGTVVLIPPDAGKRKGTRPGWDGASTRSCAGCSPASAAASSTPSAKA